MYLGYVILEIAIVVLMEVACCPGWERGVQAVHLRRSCAGNHRLMPPVGWGCAGVTGAPEAGDAGVVSPGMPLVVGALSALLVPGFTVLPVGWPYDADSRRLRSGRSLRSALGARAFRMGPSRDTIGSPRSVAASAGSPGRCGFVSRGGRTSRACAVCSGGTACASRCTRGRSTRGTRAIAACAAVANARRTCTAGIRALRRAIVSCAIGGGPLEISIRVCSAAARRTAFASIGATRLFGCAVSSGRCRPGCCGCGGPLRGRCGSASIIGTGARLRSCASTGIGAICAFTRALGCCPALGCPLRAARRWFCLCST